MTSCVSISKDSGIKRRTERMYFVRNFEKGIFTQLMPHVEKLKGSWFETSCECWSIVINFLICRFA
jgi:hypothetical protein